MFLHGMGGPQHSWSARPLEEARLRERSSNSVPHLVSWCESTEIYIPGLKRGLQLSALTDQKALLEQEDPKDHRIPNHSRAVWKQSGWDAAALLGRYKMPTCHAEKAKRSPRCFSFLRERASDEFLTCPASCFPKCWELPVASGLAGASSAFLVFPSVKPGCYWGHHKDWLDRSVSWSHFSQWLQWDAQPRTMAGYTTLNISAVLWKMKSSDFSTYVSGGAEKLFMMFTADTADIIHENMGNGALFLYRDNL